MNGPTRHPLPGGRWHFQHGPIDLVIAAEGDAVAVAAAHEAAWQRFSTLLSELVAELPLLRQPVVGDCALRGGVARRMWMACQPFTSPLVPQFITPMAAVAGAVAQELITCYERDSIRRAWVNNGGDIALHLARGESARVGVFSDVSRAAAVLASLPPPCRGRGGGFEPHAASPLSGPGVQAGMRSARRVGEGVRAGQCLNFEPPSQPSPLKGEGASHRLGAIDGHLTVHSHDSIRGIATSGWRGRSHSLGIADSVTVLAATAAQADAAATMIANAVNIDHAGIQRRPACELRDDSDLGAQLVTVDVPVLPAALRDAALRAGARRAAEFQQRGLITAAVLMCQGAAIEVAAPVHAELAA